MFSLNRIAPSERLRFVTLASLLFINAIVVQSNGVVATSGFIAKVGLQQLLIVWTIDNIVILIGSGLYSIFVDRMKRTDLMTILFSVAAVTYLVMYALFVLGAPSYLSYTLLMVLNDQQWILFGLAIWALANDTFSVSESKRLFPLMAVVALLGGIAGNALATGISWLATQVPGLEDGVRTTYMLMLFNAALMAASAGLVVGVLRRLNIVTHQDRSSDGPVAIIKEGISFVQEIPAFRYLALSMLVVGFGLNTLQYQFFFSAEQVFSDPNALGAFYGAVRMVRMISLLLIQGLLTTWVLQNIGFRSVFIVLPVVMLGALVAPILLPGIIAITIGDYLVRITMDGVDESARQSFIGLVPDERRGRVNAFFNGYLYPIGSIASCGLIGLTIYLEGNGVFPEGFAATFYLTIAALLVASAIYSVRRLRANYDSSLLNWRLRRRKRGSVLSNLDL